MIDRNDKCFKPNLLRIGYNERKQHDEISEVSLDYLLYNNDFEESKISLINEIENMKKELNDIQINREVTKQ